MHVRAGFRGGNAGSCWTRYLQGDYGPSFDSIAEDIVVENGPGAGPWHRATNRDDMALMLLEFSAALGDTFRQHSDLQRGHSVEGLFVTVLAPPELPIGGPPVGF